MRGVDMTRQTGDMEHQIRREAKGRKRLIGCTAVAGVAALATVVTAPSPVFASSSSSSQTVTATVLAGVLTVTAPSPLVSNFTPGQTTSATLGNLAFTNTLNDGSSWSVTASSTDWKSGANLILFTDMTFVTSGSSISPAQGSSGGTPTVGSGGALSGADTTPGTTQSSAVTLATGTSAQQGIYTMSGNSLSVLVLANTPQGAYAGTIQYTVTG